jgi:hypothetical protein
MKSELDDAEHDRQRGLSCLMGKKIHRQGIHPLRSLRIAAPDDSLRG